MLKAVNFCSCLSFTLQHWTTIIRSWQLLTIVLLSTVELFAVDILKILLHAVNFWFLYISYLYFVSISTKSASCTILSCKSLQGMEAVGVEMWKLGCKKNGTSCCCFCRLVISGVCLVAKCCCSRQIRDRKRDSCREVPRPLSPALVNAFRGDL